MREELDENGIGEMSQQPLTDDEWRRISLALPGHVGLYINSGAKCRRFIDGVCWVLTTGSMWQDLPARFGRTHTITVRYGRWVNSGNWEKVICALGKSDRRSILIAESVSNYLDAIGHRQLLAEMRVAMRSDGS